MGYGFQGQGQSFLIPLGGRATYVVGLGALSSAEVKAAMAKQENAIAPMTPDASLQLFRTEQERYAKLVKKADIKLD